MLAHNSSSSTMRENLGLERSVSQFTVREQKAA